MRRMFEGERLAGRAGVFQVRDRQRGRARLTAPGEDVSGLRGVEAERRDCLMAGYRQRCALAELRQGKPLKRLVRREAGEAVRRNRGRHMHEHDVRDHSVPLRDFADHAVGGGGHEALVREVRAEVRLDDVAPCHHADE